MAASVQIPVDVYLHTSYRPDREYVDGEVKERNVGKWEHARLQWLLAWWFGTHEAEWGCIGSTEQRVAVSKTRIRIPDLVILEAGHPPDVLVDAPLLVIEILSPDDTYSDTQERATDYRNMGVETIWIIDPRTRTARVCHDNIWLEASRLEVPGTKIYADLSKLFERLDESKPKA